MGLMKKIILFTVGGCGYVTLELLWRGRSHGSMFFAGGSCFMLLGKLRRTPPQLSVPIRAGVGACIITGVELLTGLLVNRDFSVWDYRQLPMNYRGQVCLPYTLLWIPVSLFAMTLYDAANKKLA